MGITVILDDPAGNSYLQVRVTLNVCIMEEVQSLHMIHVCVPCYGFIEFLALKCLWRPTSSVAWGVWIFIAQLAGKARQLGCPKIVLDHVRVLLYICLCALGFLTIGCIRCYWQRIFLEGYEDWELVTRLGKQQSTSIDKLTTGLETGNVTSY